MGADKQGSLCFAGDPHVCHCFNGLRDAEDTENYIPHDRKHVKTFNINFLLFFKMFLIDFITQSSLIVYFRFRLANWPLLIFEASLVFFLFITCVLFIIYLLFDFEYFISSCLNLYWGFFVTLLLDWPLCTIWMLLLAFAFRSCTCVPASPFACKELCTWKKTQQKP